MASAISKTAWISLYKQLQKEASKFPQYNTREFAKRRIRDHFEQNRNTVLTNEGAQQLYKKGKEDLAALRRQVSLGQLYPHKPTVVEEKVAAATH